MVSRQFLQLLRGKYPQLVIVVYTLLLGAPSCLNTIGQVWGAEIVHLKPSEPSPRADRVEITLEGEGKLLARQGSKVESVPAKVGAKFSFWERPLKGQIGEAPSEVVRAGIRWFDSAETTGQVGGQPVQIALRPDRRLIFAKVHRFETTLWSSSGPLTRGELDLLRPTPISLVTEELLPSQPVRRGDKWSLPAEALAVIMGLEGVASANVEATLLEVVGDIARVEFSGRVEGAAEAMSTQLSVRGRYQFSLSKGRIIWLGLAYHEKRDSGPIAPGVDMVTRIAVQVQPEQECQQVEDPNLILQAFQPTPDLLLLEEESPDGLWRLQYDRRWHFTALTEQMAVLRMVERGTYLAQCKIARAQPTKDAISLAKFQADIRDALGSQFHRFIHASELRSTAGTPIYRVEAQGVVSGVPVVWIFYWIRGPQAEALVISFTLEQALYDRFAQADRELLEGLKFRVEEVALRSR